MRLVFSPPECASFSVHKSPRSPQRERLRKRFRTIKEQQAGNSRNKKPLRHSVPPPLSSGSLRGQDLAALPVIASEARQSFINTLSQCRHKIASSFHSSRVTIKGGHSLWVVVKCHYDTFLFQHFLLYVFMDCANYLF